MAGRAREASAVLVLVAVLLAVVARDSRESTADPGTAYVLVQLNLCLSGRAGCFDRVDYPAGVHDAVAVIRDTRADAVTLVEVCAADVEAIAAATGLEARFAPVSSRYGPVTCVDPGERGGYGVAVLTRERVLESVEGAYADQDDVEERRWLCSVTAATTVCATHLDIRGWERVAAVNDAQCAELAGVLARVAGGRPLIAGGDMNRDETCAASGMGVATDADAGQAPGKQHVYTTGAFSAPTVLVLPMPRTDHDALVVTSRLAP